jgi:hypothetical protein
MGAIYPGPGWQGRHGRDMYASDFLHFNSQVRTPLLWCGVVWLT